MSESRQRPQKRLLKLALDFWGCLSNSYLAPYDTRPLTWTLIQLNDGNPLRNACACVAPAMFCKQTVETRIPKHCKQRGLYTQINCKRKIIPQRMIFPLEHSRNNTLGTRTFKTSTPLRDLESVNWAIVLSPIDLP